VIGRRTVLHGLLGVTVGVSRHAFAQTARSVRRVVVYSGIPRWNEVISDGLRDLGWAVRQDVIVEWHTTVGAYEVDLRKTLQHPVDVLIMGGPLAIRAAMMLTDKVPIVGIDLESDPIAGGFVKSLARPGKNVSGVWMDLPQLAGKQLQFLRETVPGLSRVGVIWDDRIGQPQWTEAQAAGRAANVTLHPVTLHEESQTDDAIKRLLVERPQALLLLTSPVVFRSLSRLAALAIQHRLPSISPFSTYPESGGLMA
jgi:putative ABC transport system substrate-binding protein